MGLFSRFMPNQDGSKLHSSGIVGNDASIGVTSKQSFEQRQAIEKNRQLVGGYRDAGVLHNYRRNVHEERGSARQDVSNTSRIAQRSTSRIDSVATPPRPVFATPIQPRSGFREPGARGYNPYK